MEGVPYFRGNMFVATNPLQSYANLIMTAGKNLHFGVCQLPTVEQRKLRTILWVNGVRRTPMLNERVARKEYLSILIP